MNVIGYQRPTNGKGFRLGDDITQTFDKIIPVLIIGKDTTVLDTANDDMMQGAGSINSGFAWHKFFVSFITQIRKLYIYGCPRYKFFVLSASHSLTLVSLLPDARV